jgi:hypothetical protein
VPIGPSYELRPAEPGDDEFLYALHRESLRQSIKAAWGPWDDEVQRAFHRRWFDPGRIQLVLVDGEPAGMLEVHPPSAGVLYLARLEPNLHARALYERLGFQVTAAEPPKLRMRLDLRARRSFGP